MQDRDRVCDSTLGQYAAWRRRFLPSRETGTLAIGSQTSAITLLVLERRRLLERRLGSLGYDVTWTRFASGPALIESMADGLVDLGYSGTVLPILALARGAPIVTLVNDLPSPRSTAVVVAHASPLSRLSQLRGRPVAFDQDSSAEWVLASALRKVNLKIGDIVPLPLRPEEAELAFRSGAADAWVVSDPELAAAQAAGGRILADAIGVTPNYRFYIARKGFAERAPRVLQAVLSAIAETEADIAAYRPQIAVELAAILGQRAPTLNLALSRKARGIAPTEEAALVEQQQIANYFAAAERIPNRLDVATLPNRQLLPIEVQ